jgi:hypothetical protein
MVQGDSHQAGGEVQVTKACPPSIAGVQRRLLRRHLGDRRVGGTCIFILVELECSKGTLVERDAQSASSHSAAVVVVQQERSVDERGEHNRV